MGEVVRFPSERVRAPVSNPNSKHDEVPVWDIKDELGKREGNEKRNGHVGALLVGATVAAWDFSNNETITSFVGRGVRHENPYVRAGTVAAIGYVALHLLDRLPDNVDVFDQIAKLPGRFRSLEN